MTKPKAISLFCGAGGCSLGFKKAGYDIVYASDIDKAAIQTYKANFPETTSEVKDIHEFDCTQLLKKLNIKKGELDILIGGPPCQGFSTAGTRFWNDPRNKLLKEYVRCLSQIQPKWFLMENVEGLFTIKKGEYVYEAARAFIELGYNIRIEKVYAHEYGVPQRRKRVLIVGNRLGYNYQNPPVTNPITGRIFKNSSVTLSDALINLPYPSDKSEKEISYEMKNREHPLFNYFKNETGLVSEHVSPPIKGINLDRIRALKPGHTMRHLPENLQHESFKKRASRRVMDGTPSEKRGGAPSGLKRLFLNQPSLTITSAATREFIHPIEDRTLTIRECARIQTFPDYFVFVGTQGQKVTQIGNAIPPLLAKIFALHIKDTYGFTANDPPYGHGKLLGFSLSKATEMSPALHRTKRLLTTLQNVKHYRQLDLF